MTISEALTWGRNELKTTCDAEFSARFLLGEILELDSTQLVLRQHEKLDANLLSKYQDFIERRATGTPLGYILGYQYFDGQRFKVTKDTLIPRPETELLVSEAYSYIRAQEKPLTIVDVGTGSGAIAVSLAHRLKKSGVSFSLFATDTSPDALVVARDNAKDISEVTFVEANLLEPKDSQISLIPNVIVANLPYIPAERLKNLEVTKYEPISALDGGEDGLDCYRELMEQIKKMSTLPEALFFEIDETQGLAIRDLVKQLGYKAIIIKDLNGLDRILAATK